MTARPVVIMAPGDVITLKTQPIVAAQLLREAGFKVDVQATDWQTVVTRRASQKPPTEGGWNMFFTNLVVPDIANPIAHYQINAKGTKGGWFGWPQDSNMEELRDAFVRAKTVDEAKEIATEIQARNYEQVIYIPLGQYRTVSVWRKEISGMLAAPAPPIFWNVEKTD
jgi:peptide/nickel transport system substrate-binding protein